MTRGVLAVLMLLVGVALVGPVATAQPGPEDGAPALEPPAPIRGDENAVAELLRERRVETRPTRPGLGAYLGDVSLMVGRWIAELIPGFERVSRLLGTLDPRWLWALLLVLILAAALTFLRRRAPAPGAPPMIHDRAADDATPVAARDWRAALRERLGAGDARAALEALWWWLADRLGAPAEAATWTGGELLRRAARPDLAGQVRALDRLRYGGGAPEIPAVRELWQELEAAMGAESALGANPS